MSRMNYRNLDNDFHFQDNNGENVQNTVEFDNLNNRPNMTARDHLFHAMFSRIALTYDRTFPSAARKFIEFFLLLTALSALFILIYIHVAFVKSPITCLDHVSFDDFTNKADFDVKNSVIRVEILSNPPDNYSLMNSYDKEYDYMIPKEASYTKVPEESYEEKTPTSEETFRKLLFFNFIKRKCSNTDFYCNSQTDKSHTAATEIRDNDGDGSDVNQQNKEKISSSQPENKAKNYYFFFNLFKFPNFNPILEKAEYWREKLSVKAMAPFRQTFNELELFAKSVFTEEKYIMEYSLEYGLLRLSPKVRERLKVPVHFILLDATKDKCFGGPLSRFLLQELVGYDQIIIGSLKRLAEKQNGKGFVRNVVSGEHYRFVNSWMSRTSYLAAGFIMVIFTLSVSMLLRYSHHQIFVFIVDLLRMLENNLQLSFPAAPLLTVVLALVGMEAIMSEFFNDTSTAFYTIVIIWLADQYEAICCRTFISKYHWPKYFYLYHFAFYAYHYRFNGQFSGLALLCSWLFIQHSMCFFFHHYELPRLLHGIAMRHMVDSIIVEPNGDESVSGTNNFLDEEEDDEEEEEEEEGEETEVIITRTSRRDNDDDDDDNNGGDKNAIASTTLSNGSSDHNKPPNSSSPSSNQQPSVQGDQNIKNHNNSNNITRLGQFKYNNKFNLKFPPKSAEIKRRFIVKKSSPSLRKINNNTYWNVFNINQTTNDHIYNELSTTLDGTHNTYNNIDNHHYHRALNEYQSIPNQMKTKVSRYPRYFLKPISLILQQYQDFQSQIFEQMVFELIKQTSYHQIEMQIILISIENISFFQKYLLYKNVLNICADVSVLFQSTLRTATTVKTSHQKVLSQTSVKTQTISTNYDEKSPIIESNSLILNKSPEAYDGMERPLNMMSRRVQEKTRDFFSFSKTQFDLLPARVKLNLKLYQRQQWINYMPNFREMSYLNSRNNEQSIQPIFFDSDFVKIKLKHQLALSCQLIYDFICLNLLTDFTTKTYVKLNCSDKNNETSAYGVLRLMFSKIETMDPLFIDCVQMTSEKKLMPVHSHESYKFLAQPNWPTNITYLTILPKSVKHCFYKSECNRFRGVCKSIKIRRPQSVPTIDFNTENEISQKQYNNKCSTRISSSSLTDATVYQSCRPTNNETHYEISLDNHIHTSEFMNTTSTTSSIVKQNISTQFYHHHRFRSFTLTQKSFGEITSSDENKNYVFSVLALQDTIVERDKSNQDDSIDTSMQNVSDPILDLKSDHNPDKHLFQIPSTIQKQDLVCNRYFSHFDPPQSKLVHKNKIVKNDETLNNTIFSNTQPNDLIEYLKTITDDNYWNSIDLSKRMSSLFSIPEKQRS